MSYRRLVAALSVVACCAAPAAGEQLSLLEVTYEEGRYSVRAEVVIDASRERVYGVFTDYPVMTEFDKTIKESEVVREIAENVHLVRSLVENCVLFVCRDVRRLERIAATPYTRIEAHILPEESDLSFGESVWVFEDAGAATSVAYSLSIEPAFHIPRIGRGAVKRQLRNTIRNTFAAVQRLAAAPPADAPSSSPPGGIADQHGD